MSATLQGAIDPGEHALMADDVDVRAILQAEEDLVAPRIEHVLQERGAHACIHLVVQGSGETELFIVLLLDLLPIAGLNDVPRVHAQDEPHQALEASDVWPHEVRNARMVSTPVPLASTMMSVWGYWLA